MPTINTFGLPKQTYKVSSSASDGVEAHHVVCQGDGPREVVPPGASPSTIVGVASTKRPAGDPVAVTELGEATVISAGAISLGDSLAIADAAGRVQAAADGAIRVGVARSAADGENEQVACDLSVKNTLGSVSGA